MINWEPYATLNEFPEGHPAHVPLDVVADVNGETSFRAGPFTRKEVELLDKRLKTFGAVGDRYLRAIEEAKAADEAVNYYPPGPERDSAVVLRSVAREELATATAALQVAAAKLTATIRALRAVVASRRLSTGSRDVDSAAVRAGLTGRSDAVREAATALGQLGVRDDDPLDRWVREGRARELIRGG